MKYSVLLGSVPAVSMALATSAAINSTVINADLTAVGEILTQIAVMVATIIGLIITLTIVSMIKGILLGIRDGVVRSLRF